MLAHKTSSFFRYTPQINRLKPDMLTKEYPKSQQSKTCWRYEKRIGFTNLRRILKYAWTLILASERIAKSLYHSLPLSLMMIL
jgi:hypothetical protein